MKKKLFSFLLLTTLINFSSQRFYFPENKPSNPNVTPTTPQRIYNYQSLVGGRNFYCRRIYFGKDRDGNPIYKSIERHAKENPEFGNVTLVIFHKAAWYKLRFSDTFEIVGNYSDEDARKIAIYNMTPFLWENNHARGAMWDPKQNAIFVGDGTEDPEIGDRFAQYLKEQEEAEQSGKSKGKKIISSNKSEN